MARIRTIKPKFWDDLKLAKVSRDARLTYIGLWNFSDDLGTVVSDPNWIKAKLYPYDDIKPAELASWLRELEEKKFMVKFSYKEAIYYYIPKLIEHQVINKPNLRELYVPSSVIESIKDKSITNPVSITDSSGSDMGGRGEEGKGIGREEEGNVPLSGDRISDIEVFLLNNQIQFERICMNSKNKDPDHCKKSLRKYHLWLTENEKYPRTKTGLLAGFEKWLLNEKSFNNAGNKPNTTGVNKSAGASIIKQSLGSDIGLDA